MYLLNQVQSFLIIRMSPLVLISVKVFRLYLQDHYIIPIEPAPVVF